MINQLRKDAKVIQERVAQLALEKMELESRLQSINTESKHLSILSCEKNEDIDKKELEVAKIQNEVNTPAIKEEVIEALATVHKSMEATHEEFKSFTWKI